MNLYKYINRESISYLICGGVTTVIGIGSFAIAMHFGLNTATANTISTVLAVSIAFIFNKVIVFRSLDWSVSAWIKEFAKFCGARAFTFILETAALILLVDRLGFHDLTTKTFTVAMVIIGNYVLSKWLVFR